MNRLIVDWRETSSAYPSSVQDFIGPHALGMTSTQVVSRLIFSLTRAACESADEADF